MTVPAAPQRNVAEADADVIVVGAGPAGSTTAFHLAQAGLDVLLLEKTTFPREKVCGDGLTPRAVKQLIAMGVDIDAPGWVRNKGLRVVGGGLRFELDWPELSSYPDFGLVRTRQDFDQILAENAVKAGARLLQGVNVTAPILDERSGHIVGVVARKDGEEVSYRSRLVVAADGNSTRVSLAMGLHKREDRPMGVAVRTYFTSPRHDDDYLETWLELWDGDTLLPGYGWIFGVGDGTSNVGLGLLNTSDAFKGMDYRDLLRRWVKGMPAEWGYVEENMTTPIRGAALPMAFNRQPHYTRGLVLVGDAGGMINPFNGEGIAYAMETGHIAAESIVQALGRVTPAQRERVLRAYPQTLKDVYGGYFTLGRGFVELIGNRGVMNFLTRHALPHPRLMRFTLKLLANLTDRRGDASDRIINALSKVAPPA
ncbi:geranylgeranyl reductase family protein [Streptosporangium becharense]|uniref:Geranylgeranyl reductase family protein n=1 Tax=Streptosporangium becharense TaxID=1816182 RepID=A0A7W9IGE8_9ACTN|nr:geranylgeranyl reductase family protein [Streptosporangium becharense]MBB2909047.1 geranylgeranyl reductase family protein [Streptosporangium becharense]MBB5819935.1 geranylgeranyl reductase family protein [Streptosporangium becharense]